MTSLLFELFSEEIPARMQVRAAEQLRDLLGEVITSEGLAWQEARVFATARRLALTAHGLPLVQADRPIERKGPRVGAPQAAMDGFLRSLGDVDYRLEERAEKKGEAVYALYTAKGRSTAEILGEALPNLLAKFPWPKSMRWGDGDARWVRPLQAIVCLLDGEIVPFAFAGIDAGRTTFGHRFMAPDAIEISGADDYRPQLEAAYVMLDGAQRRELIAERASLIASQQGLVLRNDPGLLRELEGLAEWPVLLLGAIDPQFMDLPAEVLVISMRSHQKYLALETADGALAARFIIVANIEAKDGGAAIIAGNERVLRARLWDAKFFWDRDLKKPLEERLPALENMVFQAELGTLREKVERIERLAA
ncbi:MAG: glycine--tRNA ligase subunit beta, partial [Pseudomonadota bacterium]